MTVEIAFSFPLAGGLHARPASRLQEEVVRFRAAVTFLNRASGASASARSVLALVATRTGHGEPCVLHVQGEDEAASADALRRFVKKVLPGLDEAPSARAPAGGPLPRALAVSGARVHRGAPASGGVFRGRAVVVGARTRGAAEERTGTVEEELGRLGTAFDRAAITLRARRDAAEYDTEREVLGAHLSIAEDPGLRTRAAAAVSGGAGAAAAVYSAAEHFAEVFRASGSALLAERALDIHDVAEAVVHALAGDAPPEPPVVLGDDSIVVAARLGPAQLLALPRARVRGLVLAEGGTLSHTVVLARAFGVPCVTGVDGVDRLFATGDELIVDGERGLVVAAPKEAVARFYEGQEEVLAAAARRLERFRTARGVAADGRRIEVGANVGTVEEARVGLRERRRGDRPLPHRADVPRPGGAADRGGAVRHPRRDGAPGRGAAGHREDARRRGRQAALLDAPPARAQPGPRLSRDPDVRRARRARGAPAPRDPAGGGDRAGEGDVPDGRDARGGAGAARPRREGEGPPRRGGGRARRRDRGRGDARDPVGRPLRRGHRRARSTSSASARTTSRSISSRSTGRTRGSPTSGARSTRRS